MEFSAATDWRNAFFDGSVALPDGFPEPVVRACGWIRAPIAEDAEFFGKWRGWLDVGGYDYVWSSIAPEKWREVEAILPDPALREACQWDRSPLPGAVAR